MRISYSRSLFERLGNKKACDSILSLHDLVRTEPETHTSHQSDGGRCNLEGKKRPLSHKAVCVSLYEDRDCNSKYAIMYVSSRRRMHHTTAPTNSLVEVKGCSGQQHEQ